MPLNRYADVNGHQEVVTPSAGTPNSTLRSNQGYKMVARALFNFQPQNHRELGFKKGDIIYVKRQVDSNWYEGERNAMIGEAAFGRELQIRYGFNPYECMYDIDTINS